MRQHLALAGLLLILRSSAIGLCATDIGLTTAILHQGGHEANPLMGSSPSVAKIIALDGGTLGAIYLLEAKHPRLAKALYVAVIATRGFATVHNSRELR